MNRFLGWVAWLGTLRKQAIAPHLLLLVVCLTGFTWGLGNYLEASQNGGGAAALTQRQLLEQGAPQSFVELTGTVLADGGWEGPEHTIFLPLLDQTEKIVTYVRVKDDSQAPRAGVTCRVSGMVCFVDAESEKHIPQDQGGLRFNCNQYIHTGQRPADPRWAVAAMLAAVLCSWPLLVTWFGHYIVFAEGPVGESVAEQPGKVLASGQFFRGKKEKRRFLEASAELRQRDGLWELKLDEDWSACFERAENVRAGSLFLGSQQRPALRLDALEKTRGKRQTYVLSFEGQGEMRLTLEQFTSSSATL